MIKCFCIKNFNQKSWKSSSYVLMSKPCLHILVVLQSSSMFRGPACAVICSLRKTEVLFTEEKNILFQIYFFKGLHSCSYSRALERKWIQSLLLCFGTLGNKKDLSFALTNKIFPLCRGSSEDKLGRGEMNLGLWHSLKWSKGSKRWGRGCCLEGLVALKEKAGNILAPKINGNCGWSRGYLPGSKAVSASLATLYYAPHAPPAVAVLYFVERLNRLFRQLLPNLALTLSGFRVFW